MREQGSVVVDEAMVERHFRASLQISAEMPLSEIDVWGESNAEWVARGLEKSRRILTAALTPSGEEN